MNAIMIAGTFGHGAQLGSMSGDDLLLVVSLIVVGAMLLTAGVILSRDAGSVRLHAIRYNRQRR